MALADSWSPDEAEENKHDKPRSKPSMKIWDFCTARMLQCSAAARLESSTQRWARQRLLTKSAAHCCERCARS